MKDNYNHNNRRTIETVCLSMYKAYRQYSLYIKYKIELKTVRFLGEHEITEDSFNSFILFCDLLLPLTNAIKDCLLLLRSKWMIQI